jgi:gamma-glutamylcyclotransferase (GGCT)/AIG2-like uncharacterized protein YtfP
MAVLLQNHSVNKEEATFTGKLYNTGSYPAAISSDSETDEVFGELFELKNPDLIFRDLDAYEGYNPQHPKSSLFIRKKVTVHKLDDGNAKTTWIYLYNRPVNGLLHIPGGDYLEYLQSGQNQN